MTPEALVFLVNIVSSLLKKWVEPRWGKDGVLFVVFLGSVAASLFVNANNLTMGNWQIIAGQIGLIFSGAVTFYEVALKRLPLFKNGL